MVEEFRKNPNLFLLHAFQHFFHQMIERNANFSVLFQPFRRERDPK